MSRHEVLSRMVLVAVDVVREAGLPLAPLFQGLPLDEQTLKRRLYTDWDHYCLIMERAETLFGGPEPLDRAVERSYHRSVPELSRVAGTLISPKQLTWFVVEVLNAFAFPPIEGRLTDLGDERLRLTTRVRSGARPSLTFFRVSISAIANLPLHLGLPPARIEAELSPTEARYEIMLPPSRALPGRVVGASYAMVRTLLGQTTDGMPLHTGIGYAPSPDGEAHLQSKARAWGLTARQAEVLSLVARGHSNREIATALGCGENTVEVHVSQILRKGSVTSRAQLIARVWSER